jgi:hypothetical protein
MEIKMRKWVVFMAFFSIIFSVQACKNTTSTDAPEETMSECERNNTATVQFENRSASNTTYDVVWDGSKLTTLAPGTKSSTYTVSAGTTHTLAFKITNTSRMACSQSSPNLAQCQTYLYWCTY